MDNKDLKRLIKIEDRIQQIMTNDLGLKFPDIEWDVIPPQKMLEIMAYRSNTQISNWKFGRDYERLRTIFENVDPSMPYEVVIHGDPARAFLMQSNVFPVQVLVMAHVYGHAAFFTESKWFQKSRIDMGNVLTAANERFNEYEVMYGIDRVEKLVDAGHALQWHSNPFELETEDERKKRIFESAKLKNKPDTSSFSDLVISEQPKVNIASYNNLLWRQLQYKTPIEPVEDLLRYIIDNSKHLEDWQKDVLEVLRVEGQYYWPIIRTKTMNEGFGTYIHEFIMDKLFKENILSPSEHGQYNYSNSLVKGASRFSMNPYLIGSEMWKDIKNRWDKGQYGRDWDDCKDVTLRDNWDTKEMGGWEKCKDVMRSYTDWFFMQDFLTAEMVDKLDLYIYQQVDQGDHIDIVRTAHTSEQCKDLIINSFAQNSVPKIEVVDGNYNNIGELSMVHRFSGLPLDHEYTENTIRHIYYLWRKPVQLETTNTKGEILTYSLKEDNDYIKEENEVEFSL